MLSSVDQGCTRGGLPGVLASVAQECTPGGFPGVLSSLVHTWRASRGTLLCGLLVSPFQGYSLLWPIGDTLEDTQAGLLSLSQTWRASRGAPFSGAHLEAFQGCFLL